MAKSVDCVGPTAISATGGTETAIGGTWVAPAGTKQITGVKINYAADTVHDALDGIGAVRIYSRDIKVEPCDIFAEPIGSGVTNGIGNSPREAKIIPLNVKGDLGGMTFYFYGRAIVTQTTAHNMAITIFFQDFTDGNPQYHYKIATATEATTVTAAAKHTDATTYKVSGGTKITTVYGVVWQTTTTAAVGCIGKFGLESGDFKMPFGPVWASEGGGGLLLADDQDIHLSQCEVDIPIAAETNIVQVFTNGPTNIVGAFITGVQYLE